MPNVAKESTRAEVSSLGKKTVGKIRAAAEPKMKKS
jgi:hypothetical protein